ncbi:cytochrome-c peroxidase [Calycomorphotria hydatis]|uniref:Cytochrome c551 peroxidase n=1 Tax=Calycomorphotria hydatis TaxID=2528027 RepID=A0A517TE87_9PLAN|nr:cytochrome c peroxidase [Calycomorphotria hydatis]QDT66691.1 Cytochrome c551 peroxidase precursor [Calycomorphotria hydatis]
MLRNPCVYILAVEVVFSGSFALSADGVFHIPGGLDDIDLPKNVKATPEMIELGKQLYFDKRLSKDNSISCASCHDPKFGWADPDQFSTGVDGGKGGRNAPTVINSAFNKFQFWDGRAGSLEEQALGPMANPVEMAETLDNLEIKLNKIKGYREQFQNVFGTDVTREGMATAIAMFERTVLSGDAPYDKYEEGDATAMSEAAVRGMKLFFGKAVCSSCHSGSNFTDNGFHNIGIGMDAKEPDQGRAVISKLEGDTGAFKTPTVREAAKTAPYMHDGSLKTLEEVVEHYNKGGIDNPYLDEEIFPLGLTTQEKADLVTFMKEGLSSETYPDVSPPKLPE